MKLEVREFYLSAGGEVVKIIGKKDNVYFSSPLAGYHETGKAIPSVDDSKFDLIAHIPKELHQSIINQILIPD